MIQVFRPNHLITLVVLVLTGCNPFPRPTLQQVFPTSTSPTETVQPIKTPELHTAPQFSTEPPDTILNPGEIIGFQDTYGPYFLLRPSAFSDPVQTLAVIHGTLA